MHYVYFVRCANGTLYTATAETSSFGNNHNDGRGSRYTAQRRPDHLVYSESFRTMKDAIDREHQLKRWTRAKKEALIAGDLATLKRL